MKLPRPTTDHERLEIKAATRRALTLAGGVTRFALVTRVEQPVLSKYGSPSEDTAFMPADILLDLDRDIGAPVMLGALAALAGYRLVAMEGQGTDPVGLGDVAEVHREATDVVQRLAEALANDGSVDAAEARLLRDEIAEALTVFRKLDTKLAGSRA